MATAGKRSGDQTEEDIKFARNIVDKLKVNAKLTKEERALIIEIIKNPYVSDEEENKKSNKKVQVNVKNVKSSGSQTVDITPKKRASKSKKTKEEKMMDDTYDDRRVFILMESPAVEEVKKKYPKLFSASEIRKELDRTFYPGKSDEFLQKIAYYARVIVDNTGCKHIQREIRKVIDDAQTEYDKNYALEAGAILLLPPLVNDELYFMRFDLGEPETQELLYICTATRDYKDFFVKKLLYKVVVEQVYVCETYDFREAILLYFACFFIFDISYPKHYCNTLVLIERLFLMSKDTEDVEDEVLSALKLIFSKKA